AVVEEDVDAHLLLQEGGERERAHAARYPRAVGNVDCVHSPRQEKLRAFHLLGGVAALGRNNLRQDRKLTARQLFRQPRAPLEWNGFQGAPRPLQDLNRNAPALRAQGAYCRFDRLDMLRCRPTATTHESRSALDETASITGHVFRRAEVDVPALNRARHSRIGLCGELSARYCRHALQRLQDSRRTYAAIKPNDVRAPLVQFAGEVLGQYSDGRAAVILHCHLYNHAQRADITCREQSLVGFIRVDHGFDNEQVYAALRQRCDLLAKPLPRFLERSRPQGFQTDAQRSDGARDIEVLSRHFAGQARAGQVDFADLLTLIVFFQAQPRGPKGVGLKDFRSGLHVGEVDFLHELRRAQI